MLLILFNSTHDALAGEKALQKAGVKLRVMPTPRQFTKSCGLAILCPDCSREEAQSVLADAQITRCRYFNVIEEGGTRRYEEIHDGQAE